MQGGKLIVSVLSPKGFVQAQEAPAQWFLVRTAGSIPRLRLYRVGTDPERHAAGGVCRRGGAGLVVCRRDRWVLSPVKGCTVLRGQQIQCEMPAQGNAEKWWRELGVS